MRLLTPVSTYRAELYIPSRHANGIANDPKMAQFWDYVYDVLDAKDVVVTQAIEAEFALWNYFYVARDANEPTEWSVYENDEIEDGESVISIHDTAYIPGGDSDDEGF